MLGCQIANTEYVIGAEGQSARLNSAQVSLSSRVIPVTLRCFSCPVAMSAA